jgi:hypothetical protein
MEDCSSFLCNLCTLKDICLVDSVSMVWGSIDLGLLMVCQWKR